MCIAVPNFTKIGQTVAEILHLTIFKMVALKFASLIFCTADKLWRTNVCHHAKFHQNRPNGF